MTEALSFVPLTTAIETVPASGTMGANSTVTGVMSLAGQTFQTGDIINGNATSSAVITSDGTGAASLVEINNLGTVTFRAIGNTATNAQLFTGVGTVGITGSTGNLTVNNADIASTYSVRSSAAADGVVANIRAGQIVGTSDTVNFSVNGAGNPATTGGFASALIVNTGVEGVSVATSGTNSFTIAGGGAATDAATVTITGAGANTVAIANGAIAATSNINASAATGALTLNFNGNLTSNDTITGGSGADTLRVLTAGAAVGVNVSGIETLRVSEGSTGNIIFAAAPNFSTIRVDSSALGAASTTAAIFNTVGSPATINYVGDANSAAANVAAAGVFGALTLNSSYSGTADTVALNVNNGGVAKNAAVGFATGQLTANGIETLNVTVADVTATGNYAPVGFTSNTLRSISFTTPGTLTLGGNAIIGNAVAGSATVSSINFTGVTGAVGQAANQTTSFANGAVITSGNGGTNLVFVPAVTFAGDIYTYVGGTGNDSFTFTSAAGTQLISSGGAGNDTLVAGAGTDIINGGTGADVITGLGAADTLTGGDGADLFIQQATSTAAATGGTAFTAAATTIAEGETILVAADVITDYSAAAGDTLRVQGVATAATVTLGATVITNANANDQFLLRGTYAAATGTFTAAAAGNDVLVFLAAGVAAGAGTIGATIGTASTVLQGQGANIAGISASVVV